MEKRIENADLKGFPSKIYVFKIKFRGKRFFLPLNLLVQNIFATFASLYYVKL